MNKQERRQAKDQIVALLAEATKDFEDIFEEQRRKLGMAFRTLNIGNHHSKMVFRSLGDGELEEAKKHLDECLEKYNELKQANIPSIFLRELVNDAGQELYEAVLGFELYPFLIGKNDALKISLPNDMDFDITPQALLAGMGDVASELGKLIELIFYYQVKHGSLKISRKELFERRILIAEAIQVYMDRYASAYPLVLSASRRPGQGFSNKKRGVDMGKFFGIKDYNNLIESEEVEADEEVDPARIG